MKKLTLALFAALVIGSHYSIQAMANENGETVQSSDDSMQPAEDSVEKPEPGESSDTYVPVVTPVADTVGGVAQGTGRAVKGTVHGTGKILTGHSVEGTEEIAHETVGGAGKIAESVIELPAGILGF